MGSAEEWRIEYTPKSMSEAKLDAGGLGGWLDTGPVMDVVRWAPERCRVYTTSIPEDIPPKNRLLLGSP